MRLTELIGCAVYGADGELIGNIHDLRFEADEPAPPYRTAWSARLTGFACGKRAPLGHRLGYGTGDMAGPWPLGILFRRLWESSVQIDWADVTRIDRPRIEVRHRAEHYRRR